LELTKALPSLDSVVELEQEELAPFLLEHLAGNQNHLSFTNFFATHSGGIGRHYNGDTRVEQTVREAWAWLVREGLLVDKADGWFLISYRRSSVLPKASLHPVIAERVWSNFLRGDYETAVFHAFKEVEAAVRNAGDFPLTGIGTILMGKAFKVRAGPLADPTLPEAEQLAMVNLFAGAVGLFKNPSSHRHVVLSEPREAAEMFADEDCGRTGCVHWPGYEGITSGCT
jgi:uncharacterized protein (TIGR02391 family)